MRPARLCDAGPTVAVTLVMEVSRDAGQRLSGRISDLQNLQQRDFSGTLELMRAFEELVPSEANPGADDGGGRSDG